MLVANQNDTIGCSNHESTVSTREDTLFSCKKTLLNLINHQEKTALGKNPKSEFQKVKNEYVPNVDTIIANQPIWEWFIYNTYLQ